MEQFYPTFPRRKKDEKESSLRLLKKLKIALFIWLVSFIATMIWFSFSKDF